MHRNKSRVSLVFPGLPQTLADPLQCPTHNQGAGAGTQRQQPVSGSENSKASQVRSLENLSGRDADHDHSVHLYLIHVPRTKFHRGQTNTLDSRTANKIVLHFVLKANNKVGVSTGGWGQGGRGY